MFHLITIIDELAYDPEIMHNEETTTQIFHKFPKCLEILLNKELQYIQN